MQKILNLTDILKQRKDQDITAQLLQMTILQTLQDITQEINAVTGAWERLKEENGHEYMPTMRKAAAVTGEDYIYNLRELILFHVANLQSMAMILDEVITKEPSRQKQGELYMIRQELAQDYQKHHKTIYARNVQEVADIIRDGQTKIRSGQAERSGQDPEE